MADLVWGMGPEPCLAMIVGEAPGAEEERLGAPFVGPSGAQLERALNEAGMERRDVYITNVYKLRPPGNRNPTDGEQDAPIYYMDQEIRAVQPSFILLLGVAAAKHFFGKSFKEMTTARGKWRVLSRTLDNGEEIEALCTYPPAATMYDRDKWSIFAGDVAYFVERVRAYEHNNTAA